MSKAWPLVALGEVLEQVSRAERVEPAKEYRLLGVRLEGEGPFLREAKLGSQTSANQLFQVQEGDFIYSRLFAWRGAFGVIGTELDGCYVSNEFPTFRPVPEKIDVKFLRYWFRLPTTITAVEADCTGSTPLTRNRFKEQFFRSLKIPLPPLAEQRRIVARIEELAAKIEEARGLRSQCQSELKILKPALSGQFIATNNVTRIEMVAAVIDPNPSHRYPIYSNDGVPIISTVDFKGTDAITTVTAKKVPLDFYVETLGKHGVGEKDVIFSRKGKIGYARLHPDGQLAMTHTLCVIKPNRDILLPRYLLHYVRSREFLNYLEENMNPNTGVPTLGLNVIRNAPIVLPSLQEQERFIAYMDDLQSKLDVIHRLHAGTAAELDAMLPSILDKAFKGELC